MRKHKQMSGKFNEMMRLLTVRHFLFLIVLVGQVNFVYAQSEEVGAIDSSDFNRNGNVDFPDFLIFANGFGKKSIDAEFNSMLDLDQSGDVDFGDFLIFAQNFGKGIDNAISVDLPGEVSMDFIKISAGKFLMGAPDSIGDSSEHPQHEVTITQDFYLGKYEVTQGQWQAVMGTKLWVGVAFAFVQDQSQNPAVYISWNDAQRFIQKLNSAEGDSLYRLPTEAEWEYACRAGTVTKWSFGDVVDDLTLYAWFNDNTIDVGEIYAHSVGLKMPNPWGLYDMHGNVWEWCQDWYASDYYSVANPTDPMGPSSGQSRIRRGGFFVLGPSATMSANRASSSPGERSEGIGFRLLRRK